MVGRYPGGPTGGPPGCKGGGGGRRWVTRSHPVRLSPCARSLALCAALLLAGWLAAAVAAFYCSHTSRAAEPELLRHIPSPFVSAFYFLLWRLDPRG